MILEINRSLKLKEQLYSIIGKYYIVGSYPETNQVDEKWRPPFF